MANFPLIQIHKMIGKNKLLKKMLFLLKKESII